MDQVQWAFWLLIEQHPGKAGGTSTWAFVQNKRNRYRNNECSNNFRFKDEIKSRSSSTGLLCRQGDGYDSGRRFRYADNSTILYSLEIIIKNLAKRFNKEWIFRNLDFHLEAGTTYAITGPNGSGKSTLLQVLWGQVPQTSGAITYKKGDIVVPVEEISRHVAIATPYMDLIEEFTLDEQLSFHFKIKSPRPGVSIPHLLDILYLTSARDKLIGNFSSGMKQRLKLGMAFYTQADLLFLDEPGTNLDSHAFEWYRNELKKVSPACLIIVASNNPLEYPENTTCLNVAAFKK